MNNIPRHHMRRLLIFLPILLLSIIAANVFHTDLVLAATRWIDGVGGQYIAYQNGSTWLYWNTRYNTWAFVGSTPQIKLNGSACDRKSPDTHKDFNSSATFNGCKGLIITAYDNAAFFKEAQLAYQIADFDSRETINVKGGYIAGYGNSTNPPIGSDGKSAIAYKGVTFDTNGNGKKDLNCDSPNPNTSNGCSLLLYFDYAHGNEFEINLNNKWNDDGTASSGHEFWYDSPATGEYRTLTFNTNGGTIPNDQKDRHNTVTLWEHPSGSNLLREYKKDAYAGYYPIPTRDGYTFDGWYSGTTNYHNGAVAGDRFYLSGNATLTAHWQEMPKPNILTCILKFNDGIGSSLLVSNASTLNVSGSGNVSPPLRITGSITGPATNQPFTVNGASGTVPFTPPNKGMYTVTATAYDASNASPTCSTTIPAGDRPYFELSGGDAIAGIGNPAKSNVMTWNTGSPSYAGGNTNLAVIATGRIDGVVTGTGNSPLPALSFGSTNTGGTDFGGGFESASLPADVNYSNKIDMSSATPITNNLTINPSTNGVFVADSQDVTVHGTVSPGKTVILVVKGHNIYVDNTGVEYSYTSLSDVPRFSAYAIADSGAGGNIVISNTVSTLHGNYVADATFYTCGDGPSGGYDYSSFMNNTGRINNCANQQLTMYGTVAAKKVVLGRTSGSYVKPNTAAETFKYGPEVWLGAPTSTRQYDYYVSLPPIL